MLLGSERHIKEKDDMELNITGINKLKASAVMYVECREEVDDEARIHEGSIGCHLRKSLPISSSCESL